MKPRNEQEKIPLEQFLAFVDWKTHFASTHHGLMYLHYIVDPGDSDAKGWSFAHDQLSNDDYWFLAALIYPDAHLGRLSADEQFRALSMREALKAKYAPNPPRAPERQRASRTVKKRHRKAGKTGTRTRPLTQSSQDGQVPPLS